MSTHRKKLIEVALPLDDINEACAHEKSVRHGHPSTLHLWWARRPLAAARAVIFAQMVDDPSSIQGLSEEEIVRERERLFGIIRELVKWENTNNEAILEQARSEIRKSWSRTCVETGEDPNKLPAFHDPFAGGGALPLEAQRLGLEAYASDLNPVAVLINKAMIEFPQKFSGRPPVNPDSRKKKLLFNEKWRGAAGLADDGYYYGSWMRDEAEKRIGNLYPKVRITKEVIEGREDLERYKGQELTVIAWLWARTVKSPNPAFSHVDVPLSSTFMLSKKKGKEAYIKPILEGDNYRITIKVGKPDDLEEASRGTKLGRGANFRCLLSGTPIAPDHIYSEARAGRMRERLMAIVAEGDRARVYLPPTTEMGSIARKAEPDWKPDDLIPENPRWFSPPLYGLTTYGEIFTSRQLVALTTFSDLISDVREKIRQDAVASGMADDGKPLQKGGVGAIAYAESICVYLAFALSKQADLGNSLCRWEPIAQCPRQLFGRQAMPMVWDYAEGNPLGTSSGAWNVFIKGIFSAFAKTFENAKTEPFGRVTQADASTQKISSGKVISTDPPYYDNIGYADLSDFFYIWLRRSLRPLFSDIFATLAVPKAQELVATPYRHGGKDRAELFFMHGMTQAMKQLSTQGHPAFPVTIYYAFKQSEIRKDRGGFTSTGWETFLEAVMEAGHGISGTWPMRTENKSRMISQGTNALASSIVLVCRKRNRNAPTITRRDFIRALQVELPTSIAHLQKSNIAPVDLAQSAIGPGMAIFSKYSKVIEADGNQMSVKSALQIINQMLDETLGEEESVLDSDTQFAITWFETHQYSEGPFGDADNLARARNVSVAGVQDAGVLHSAAGKVRLYARSELPADWDPVTDKRLTVWEAAQYLIKRLEEDGEEAASELLKKLGPIAEQARTLSYRLYNICERRDWAEEARSYNGLVIAWPELEKLASAETSTPVPNTQTGIFE